MRVTLRVSPFFFTTRLVVNVHIEMLPSQTPAREESLSQRWSYNLGGGWGIKQSASLNYMMIEEIHVFLVRSTAKTSHFLANFS